MVILIQQDLCQFKRHINDQVYTVCASRAGRLRLVRITLDNDTQAPYYSRNV